MTFEKKETKTEKNRMSAEDYITAVTGWKNGKPPKRVTFSNLISGCLLSLIVIGVPLVILICILTALFDPYTDESAVINILGFAVSIAVMLLSFLLLYLKDREALKRLDSCTGILAYDSQTADAQPVDSRIMDADRYLFRLILSENMYTMMANSKFSAEVMQKLRHSRDACFRDAEIVRPAVQEYVRLLCETDPEFAREQGFGDMKKGGEDAAQSGTAGADKTEAGRAARTSLHQTGVFYGGYNDCDDDLDRAGRYEDDDDIALEMEEFIDDEIMFRGGDPYNWHDRAEYMKDPFGFGDSDDYDEDNW